MTNPPYDTPTPVPGAPAPTPGARASAVRSHGSRLTLTDPTGKKHVVNATVTGGHEATHVIFYPVGPPHHGRWGFTRRASEALIRADMVGRHANPHKILVEVTEAWEPDHSRVVDLVEDVITKVTREGASDTVMLHLTEALSAAAEDYSAAQAPAQ